MGVRMPTVGVRLLTAASLLAADLNGSSDPYCTFKLENSSYRSKCIPKTLNPTWNENFELSFEEDSSVVQMEVFDHDVVGSHDSLGTAEIPLRDLVHGIEKVFWIKLQGGETGENLVATLSTIFKKRKKKNLENVNTNSTFNKGRVQIGLTALDFGIGFTKDATDSPMVAMRRRTSASKQWGHSYGSLRKRSQTRTHSSLRKSK